MCSFKEQNVIDQLRQLPEDNKKLYNNIIEIINSNNIKYVISVKR